MSWRDAQGKVIESTTVASSVHSRSLQKWVSPFTWWLKCNWDDALFANQVRYGIRAAL